ncbi:MAG: acylphosphatase [Candidatus Dadabacteria bacterium]|nr:MAG: acylphosphatase [Candidatus Dadabacteria bacterium]
MNNNVTVHLIITGKVQGVCFRAWTRERARALGLSGWVKNLPDGTVEAVVSGPEALVNELIEAARSGPPAASVDDIRVEYLDKTDDFSGFDIRY